MNNTYFGGVEVFKLIPQRPPIVQISSIDITSELTATSTLLVKDDNYFPTVEEMKKHNIQGNPEKYMPMIIFFSEDPFKRLGIELSEDEEESYMETVKYAKKLVYEFSSKM